MNVNNVNFLDRLLPYAYDSVIPCVPVVFSNHCFPFAKSFSCNSSVRGGNLSSPGNPWFCIGAGVVWPRCQLNKLHLPAFQQYDYIDTTIKYKKSAPLVLKNVEVINVTLLNRVGRLIGVYNPFDFV